MIVLDWLKKLFVRNEPVETTKEENTLYEIHCHHCDNVFMSGVCCCRGFTVIFRFLCFVEYAQNAVATG